MQNYKRLLSLLNLRTYTGNRSLSHLLDQDRASHRVVWFWQIFHLKSNIVSITDLIEKYEVNNIAALSYNIQQKYLQLANYLFTLYENIDVRSILKPVLLITVLFQTDRLSTLQIQFQYLKCHKMVDLYTSIIGNCTN